VPKLRREISLAIRLDTLSYSEIAERTELSVIAHSISHRTWPGPT